MPYKLIALDIDGTIRSNDYALSQYTREAIDLVLAQGAMVTLATGRTFNSALQATAELNITSPIVSFQGAHIADPVSKEVLWCMPLTESMVSVVLDELESWDLQVLAYHADQVYVDRMTPWVENYGHRNGVKVTLVDDLNKFSSNEFIRLVVVGDERRIQLLESHLGGKFKSTLHVTRSLPYFCEILHPDAGKDKALAWLCDALGIQQSEVIAFGNGYNDFHMLKWAGLGVAVGGAVPEVLKIADKIARPIEEDGVGRIISSLLSEGLIGGTFRFR